MFALKFETEKATPILDGLFGWNEWETNIEYGLGSWYKPLEGSWFPLRRVFLVVESLTRQNWEWNSINNLLSVVNLKTLSKFFEHTKDFSEIVVYQKSENQYDQNE